MEIPTGTYTVQVQWKNGGGQAEKNDVEVDATFGTFSAELTVAPDADYKDTQVHAQTFSRTVRRLYGGAKGLVITICRSASTSARRAW